MKANIAIKIRDTKTGELEPLVSPSNLKLMLFVCGPTVYDFPHLGHAKTYIQFDFIVKYLRSLGLDVFYLQNITDIDDKIIQRAKENNESPQELARRFEKIYLEDMQALGNTAVTEYARATDYISEIISQVERLLKAGFGYKTSDGIYFEISKFPDYGKLSKRQEVKENDAVSRIDASTEKRGWNDFCLWKFSKSDEPSWEAPFGSGRPGWHIEDTAITEKFFGPQYDIHGGAIDLIFPHHEAEIAQMESLSGKKPLVRIWMHTGFLNINSRKMSKSLGNFKTIRDVLKDYDFRVLRYLFVSSHYRSAIDFTDTLLEQAKSSLERIDEFTYKIDKEFDDAADAKLINDTETAINEALENDLNAPQAIATLFEFIRVQNTKEKIGKRTFELFAALNSFFGFMNLGGKKQDDAIEALIKERNEARANKDFAKADEIRGKLAQMGVKLYDTDEGTRYRI